jgi:hypothetical protein
LAFRFISSSWSYEIDKKFRSSVDMLLLSVGHNPDVSSTGWDDSLGYRVGGKRTNKKGLCQRLQGFIRIETSAPAMMQPLPINVPSFTTETPRKTQELRQRNSRRPLRLGGGTHGLLE